MKTLSLEVEPKEKTVDHFWSFIDDAGTIKLNRKLSQKLNRSGSLQDYDKLLVNLKHNVIQEILFSESARNKLTRFMSLEVYLRPMVVKAKNPFFDYSDSQIDSIIKYLYTDDLFPQELCDYDNDNPVMTYLLSQCTTPAHFVQMLAKMKRDCRMPFFSDAKFAPEVKKSICDGILRLLEADREENIYVDMFFGRYSVIKIDLEPEDVTFDFAWVCYRYLITKMLRFYKGYSELYDVLKDIDADYIKYFTSVPKFTASGFHFDADAVSAEQLKTFINNITNFIVGKGSVISLITAIETFIS